MSSGLWAWPLLAALAVTAAAALQQQPPPRFRSGIEIVQLDVSVLDRRRAPVHGLTATDFTILENGVPQRIVAFSEIDVPDPERPPTPWMRDVPSDVRRNDDGSNRRVVMIVIDDGQMREPRAARTAREIARSLIDRLGPGDLAAVVFTMDNSRAHDFTSDRRRLLAAIERTGPGELPPFLTVRYTSGVVRRATGFLGEIPQRRKVLAYIGTGLRLDLDAAASPVAVGSLASSSGDPQGDASHLRGEMGEIVETARRGNVSIYTFNPLGLVPGEPGAGSSLADDDFARTVSAGTGGAAAVNTNRFDERITQLFRENSSYYVIGYESWNPKADGGFRKLDVRVDRPGVTVRARSGYTAPRAGKTADRPEVPGSVAARPLVSEVSGLLPKDDLPMQVTAAPFAVPGRREAAVAIVVGVRQPAPQDRVEHVDVLATAFGAEGQMRASRRQSAELLLKPIDAPTQYEVVTRLDVKPGQYHLRVAASTTVHGKSGSVYHEVTVPDFSRGPLSLSGVVLAASPAVAVGGGDALGTLLPIVPTSQRVFSRDGRVRAFLRVYQGGNSPVVPATVAARITDGTGASVFDVADVLRPARFAAARSADCLLDLPLSRLSPGPHLLTVDATLDRGAAARRDVRFVVR